MELSSAATADAVRRLPGSASSSPASSCDGSSSGAAAQGRRRRRRERCHSRSASPMSAAEVAALRVRVRGACCRVHLHEDIVLFCGTGWLCRSQELSTAQWYPDEAQHGVSLKHISCRQCGELEARLLALGVPLPPAGACAAGGAEDADSGSDSDAHSSDRVPFSGACKRARGSAAVPAEAGLA